MEHIVLDDFKEDELVKKLESCLPTDKLEALARASGFVRRSTSQLTGSNFLLLNVAGSVMPQSMSLRESCIWLEDELNIGGLAKSGAGSIFGFGKSIISSVGL